MSSNETVREGVLEEEGDVEEDLAETKVARATELRTETVEVFKEYRNYNGIDLCAKGGWAQYLPGPLASGPSPSSSTCCR